MKSLMKTRKQKETGEKEVHLLEQKGYERMVNEIVPVQQAEAYRKPSITQQTSAPVLHQPI